MKRRKFLNHFIKGFGILNFIPLTNLFSTIQYSTKMKYSLYTADSRGKADYGWLKTFYSFSFADYYDPNRNNFGALRVLNDDFIDAGKGFDMHPHKNMEIITIPLEGQLAHKDSMGNQSTISPGEIQVMSAGTGILHSEFNPNSSASVKLLQIWILPNKDNVTPRYDQIKLNIEDRKNNLQQILSPNPEDKGVWIHQNAWFHIGRFEKNISTQYKIKNSKNGVFAFVISGEFIINQLDLKNRDALGIWDTEDLSILSNSENAEILLIEVPMAI